MEILCPLFGAAIIIFVIVAVVHFLWKLALGAAGVQSPFPGGACPMCARSVRQGAVVCPKCAYPLDAPRYSTLADDLEATKRQLNRLADGGRISRQLVTDVLDAIRRDSLTRDEQAWEQLAVDLAAAHPVAPAHAASQPPEPAARAESPVVTKAPLPVPAERAEFVEPAKPVAVAKEAKVSAPVFAAARATPVVPVVAPEVVEPSETRGLAGVLQSFMEEKNIRWGELLSGLLIVGSSIGLVISLWATLKEAIPYFPVAVFLAATAAMHGAGLYTLRRWRLKATSRGLLLVSTLLVPLNVLAAMVLNDTKPVYGAIDYAAVTLGLAVLAAIVLSAARVLNRNNPWPMFLAVTGAAVGTSLIGRLIVPGAPEWRTLVLFAIPFASFELAAIAHVQRLSAGKRLSPRRAAQSFRFLGIGLFSLVIAAALLAANSGNVLGTFSLLSPLVSLLGATITAAGLVIQQRMTADKDAAYCTTGTSIALGGGVLVLAAVVLAWPRPDLLVEVGLLNAVAFSALGWIAAMPALHLFATASFSLACLIAYHWTAGRITVASATTEQLAELLREARSGLILALLSLVADAAALVMRPTRARVHAAGYFASAMLNAGAAVAIAAFAVIWGLPDRNLATAVFLVLALRWLIAAWWICRPYATWIGASLLLAGLAHGLGMNSAVAAALDARGLRPAEPWTVALLLHAAICTVYAAIVHFKILTPGATGGGFGPPVSSDRNLSTDENSSVDLPVDLQQGESRAGGLSPPDVRGDQPRGSESPPAMADNRGVGATGGGFGPPVSSDRKSSTDESFSVDLQQGEDGLRNQAAKALAGQSPRQWHPAEHQSRAGGFRPLGPGNEPGPPDVRGDQPRGSVYDALILPLSIAAVVVSALAIPGTLHVTGDRFAAHTGFAFAIAAIWFVVALMQGLPVLAGAAQAIGTLGVVYGVIAHCQTRDWWNGNFFVPLHVNWQLSALAVWSGLWIAVRRAVRPIPAISLLLPSGPLTVERFVLGAVVTALAATCSLAIAPGIFAQEVLDGTTSLNSLPWHVFILAPFLIGAVLTTIRALFAKSWEQPAAVFGLAIVLALCLARVPIWTPKVSGPGFPSPYGQGFGAGAWVALALVALALIAAHWERPTWATAAGMASTLATLPILIACRWDTELATASALCWASAIMALAVSLLWGLRAPIAGIGRQMGISSESAAWSSARFVRNSLVASTGFAILAVVAGNMVGVIGGGQAVAGPLEGSVFARLGPAATDTVPLALLAASFLVYALAERNVVWGIAATFLAQFAFGLVACYAVAFSTEKAGEADFIRFVQQMGLAAGVAAVCWLTIEQLLSRRAELVAGDGAVRVAVHTQFVLAAIFAGIITVGATCGLLISPATLFAAVHVYGSPLGWCLLVLAVGIWCVRRRDGWPGSLIAPALVFFAAASPLAAASLAKWNTPDNWLSFHTAIAGWCGLIGVAAIGTLVTTVRDGAARVALGSSGEGTGGPELPPVAPRGAKFHIADWTLWLIPLVVLFACRGLWQDPLRPWWSAGSVLWISLCTLIVAALAAGRGRAYLSLSLAALGAVFIGLRPWMQWGQLPVDQDVLNLMHITVIGMTLHAIFWSAIEIMHERRGQPLKRFLQSPAPHHFAAVLGTAAVACPAMLVVFQHWFGLFPLADYPIEPASGLGWATISLLAVLCVTALWQHGSRHALPLVYAIGLIAIATVLSRLDVSQPQFRVTAVCALAGYVVVASGLWAMRRPLRTFFLGLGAAPGDDEAENVHRWLTSANLLAGVLVILAGFWIVFTFPQHDLRIAAALATLCLAPAIGLLATGHRARALQVDALVVGAIAAAQFGWALMEVGPAPHEELRRTIRLLVSLAATAFVYGVPLIRLVPSASSWFASIRRVAVGIAATAVVSTALILVFEVLAFDPTAGSPVTVVDSIVVAIALAGLAAGLISLALLPGRDPFIATEQQRFLYVYGSEAVAGLLFAHLYLTNPQFFRDLLQPYWPLVVMGVAFVGTGISELFGRLKVNVLSKPVEYTAAFLPVLPVIGFWLLSSDLNYSTTLVAVGVLYLFLSLRRGSFIYSVAAAIVGNATLCALFAENGVSLLVHPQMFIIPPCVTVLAAAQLNRGRLSVQALASVRYFAITTIYVSSTGEMFQHGIGTTLWLPMVLAGLSVLGVLAGIMLRVRAFLYLGTSFLLLSLVSMVWHASRSIGHVWPWWVFLFVLGLALLTLFGVFEKKRAEMLVMVERLKQWEK